MKKILISAMALMTISSLKAQAVINVAIGASNKSFPVVSFQGGYQYKHMIFEAGVVDAPIDETTATFFPIDMGYEIMLNDNWNITPIAGAAYRLFSFDGDKRSGNLWKYTAGVRVQWKDFYAEAKGMGEIVCFSIGIKAVIKTGY